MRRIQNAGVNGIEEESLQDLQMKAVRRRSFGRFTVTNAQEGWTAYGAVRRACKFCAGRAEVPRIIGKISRKSTGEGSRAG